jgi:thioesterase III
LGVEVQFKLELKNREHIVVTTQCLSYEKKIARLKQDMVKSSGDVACTSVFTFGLFDFNARKLILPTPEWLKAIGLPG